MTLPNQFSFPQLPNENDPEKIYQYLKEMHVELNSMYEQMAFNINGNFLTSSLDPEEKWVPTMAGSTTAGTFDYENQVGLVLRRGLIVDLWFGCAWASSSGATGGYRMNIPYKVGKNTDALIGVCFCSTLPLNAGYTAIVCYSINDTYTIGFRQYGSGVDYIDIPVLGGNGLFTGYIRYVGEEDEYP